MHLAPNTPQARNPTNLQALAQQLVVLTKYSVLLLLCILSIPLPLPTPSHTIQFSKFLFLASPLPYIQF